MHPTQRYSRGATNRIINHIANITNIAAATNQTQLPQHAGLHVAGS